MQTAKVAPRLAWFYQLYPILLALCALVSASTCQWFYSRDLATREPAGDMSLKYTLTAIPQLFASVLLLYYACTFRTRASAYRHALVIDSCVHSALATLLQAAMLHSVAHTGLSLCCAFPSLCSVDTVSCELAHIAECPVRVQHMAHYDVFARLAQTLATFALATAMASVRVAHKMQALDARWRCARFVTFERQAAVQPASASVHL